MNKHEDGILKLPSQGNNPDFPELAVILRELLEEPRVILNLAIDQ